jgi:hypothetical protein
MVFASSAGERYGVGEETGLVWAADKTGANRVNPKTDKRNVCNFITISGLSNPGRRFKKRKS